MILQMMIFSVSFSKTMFQKDMYKFFEREGMYKRYFKCFKIYVQRNIFQWFLPMFIQIYIVLCTFKRIFN